MFDLFAITAYDDDSQRQEACDGQRHHPQSGRFAKSSLRIQAAKHGRSTEDAAHIILRTALQRQVCGDQDLPQRIGARFASLGGVDLAQSQREETRPAPRLDLAPIIVLDTNALSELLRLTPDPAILRWTSRRLC